MFDIFFWELQIDMIGERLVCEYVCVCVCVCLHACVRVGIGA